MPHPGHGQREEKKVGVKKDIKEKGEREGDPEEVKEEYQVQQVEGKRERKREENNISSPPLGSTSPTRFPPPLSGIDTGDASGMQRYINYT